MTTEEQEGRTWELFAHVHIDFNEDGSLKTLDTENINAKTIMRFLRDLHYDLENNKELLSFLLAEEEKQSQEKDG